MEWFRWCNIGGKTESGLIRAVMRGDLPKVEKLLAKERLPFLADVDRVIVLWECFEIRLVISRFSLCELAVGYLLLSRVSRRRETQPFTWLSDPLARLKPEEGRTALTSGSSSCSASSTLRQVSHRVRRILASMQVLT